MKKSVRHLVYGAIVAAMYAALCHLQNVVFPGSASFAIQFRVAEALCVLALFTPAAIPGLTVGCAIFNLTFAGALPLDVVFGTLATYLACQGMWLLRKCPWAAFALPAAAIAFGSFSGLDRLIVMSIVPYSVSTVHFLSFTILSRLI